MSDTAPHADCAAIIREVNGLQTVVPLCKHRQEVIDTGLREYMALEADRDALAAENAALKADAERYRWLREHAQETPDEQGMGAQLYFGVYMAGTLDAAIDAAKGAQPGADEGAQG
jgi:hypothetical protein